MSLRKAILILLPVLWLIVGLRFGFTLDGFPEKPATHFNATGKADGWMNKEAFIASWVATLVFLNVLVIGVCWSLRFLPDTMFNLPHRDFWLSPERRGDTCGRFFELGLWLAFAITLLFGSLHESVLKANQLRPSQLPEGYWVLLIPSLLIMAVALLSFAMRLGKIPPASKI